VRMPSQLGAVGVVVGVVGGGGVVLDTVNMIGHVCYNICNSI
jgi:hypothetical protein